MSSKRFPERCRACWCRRAALRRRTGSEKLNFMTLSLLASNAGHFEEAAVLYGAQPARRRDAQRNRTAILRAACEVMTSQRPVVGMPEIARRAGIGQATLYRHFPDRSALAAGVIGYL